MSAHAERTAFNGHCYCSLLEVRCANKVWFRPPQIVLGARTCHICVGGVTYLSGLSMQMFELLGAKEFLPQRRAASDLYGKMCAQAPTFCLQAIEAICGYNDANINITRLPSYLSYTPAGASVSFSVRSLQMRPYVYTLRLCIL